MIKKIALTLLISSLIGGAYAQTKKTTTKRTGITTTKNKSTIQKLGTTIGLKSAKDSLSYAIGLDVANSLKRIDVGLDVNLIKKALDDVFDKSGNTLLKESEISNIIQSSMSRMAEEKNAVFKKVGEDFLVKNKTKPSIKVTPEGVQYEVLKEGTGKQASVQSDIKVHYLGTLLDGTKFDSSYDRNEPLDLDLNRVIEGWKIGIPLMKEGAKYRFFIPYHLAYGERATGSIPAFSTLIFEVELLEVKFKSATEL